MENKKPLLVRYYYLCLKLARHYVLWSYFFTRFAVRQFYHQRGLQIASSLTYTTLLALVPLITVMFGFLGGLPGFEGMADKIQSFIFSNFVPSFGITVQEYLQEFSQKASNLAISGILFLAVIALMLMATIDNALNLIWRVRSRRNPAARFLVYWTILTLGPVLIGIGMLSTSYLLSLQIISDMDGGHDLRELLLSWLPFLTTAVAFTLLYILIPNCFVLRRHALVGGITSAVLFVYANYGFGLFVKSVPTYEAIYGAIAIIPMFLIWVYISWVIVILGAHITFCLSAFRLEWEKSAKRDIDWTFYDVCLVVMVLWQAQKEGTPISIPHFRKHGIRLPHYQVMEILEILKSDNWVYSHSGGKWILSRDMTAVTLLDLYRIFPNRIALDNPSIKAQEETAKLREILSGYNHNLTELLTVPLGSVLR